MKKPVSFPTCIYNVTLCILLRIYLIAYIIFNFFRVKIKYAYYLVLLQRLKSQLLVVAYSLFRVKPNTAITSLCLKSISTQRRSDVWYPIRLRVI
jgi:hypothetical protein